MGSEKRKGFVIGIDFGSDSCRSVIVDTDSGKIISSSVFHYPRWKDGLYCDPSLNQFRQHPLDYIEGLEASVKGAVAEAPKGTGEQIRAIAIDTTGSTPVAVDREGTPLALLDKFADNPNAMFVLWKDHTAVKEAEEINRHAKNWGGTDFTKYSGGVYSSEWFWSKILHVYREDAAVREAAFSWVEHADWMPALLTGNKDPLKMKRSRCAAGHKAMWNEEFDGLPSEEFLSGVDPLLSGLRERLYTKTYTSDVPAGTITKEWSERLGIPADTVVGVGAFDAHMGAVGGEIKPGSLLKVMGTSTCDMMAASHEEMEGKLVRGISGQVDGSIIPGMIGMEAGQSAFGDVFAWFKTLTEWPLRLIEKTGIVDEETAASLQSAVSKRILPSLDSAAASVSPKISGELAIDWINGRRTPYADQALQGAILGLTLGSDAPRVYRALVESTAFGARSIMERFESEGVPITDVIGIGGVAKKSPFVMQVIADVLNRKILVAREEQTVAIGAAMFAAVTAGIYPDISTAQKEMGQGFEAEYLPNPELTGIYDTLYGDYQKTGKFIEDFIHNDRNRQQ